MGGFFRFSGHLKRSARCDIGLSLALYPQDILLGSQQLILSTASMSWHMTSLTTKGCTVPCRLQRQHRLLLSLGFSPEAACAGIPAYGRPLDASAQWLLYSDIDLSAVS